MNANWDFSGRTVLVPGAVGGIGQAIVNSLAAAGATVVFSDINESAGRVFEKELRDAGSAAHFFPCDATEEDQVRELVDKAVAIEGRLDAAVNVVGGPGTRSDRFLRIHDTDLSAWRNTVEINLTSCFLGMKYQIRHMLAARSGAIVNVASLAGMHWSDAAPPSYSAAKAAVIRLTRYAAVAYAADGIRVNAVAPGLTATAAVMAAFPTVEQRDALAGKQHPMGRMIEPAEIANACLWACSAASSGVTGLNIPVDGGWAAK